MCPLIPARTSIDWPCPPEHRRAFAAWAATLIGITCHTKADRPGAVARSLAKDGVLLYQADDAPTYHLTVARSCAEYLWLRLEDAALEYGVTVQAG